MYGDTIFPSEFRMGMQKIGGTSVMVFTVTSGTDPGRRQMVPRLGTFESLPKYLSLILVCFVTLVIQGGAMTKFWTLYRRE